MLVIIDNYDSFTYNLYQYIGEFYEDIKVIRNDSITAEEVLSLKPEGIILSPGPGTPENAGICIDLIQKAAGKIPILGICLGHQAIGTAFGASVVRAKEIRHGKTSRVRHSGDSVFLGIEQELTVMRYHSLIVDRTSMPESLIETAKSLDDDVVMAIKHRDYEVYGIQFHPESIFTEHGKTMIKNFVEGICHVAGSY